MHAIFSSGVLVRHPRLRFCFAHAGGAYLPLLGRIRHGYNCRPDLVAHSSQGMAPQNYLRPSQPNVWIDSLVHDPDLLQDICKKIGSERIIMGSDYPFPLGEMPVPGEMLASDERVRAFRISVKHQLIDIQYKCVSAFSSIIRIVKAVGQRFS